MSTLRPALAIAAALCASNASAQTTFGAPTCADWVKPFNQSHKNWFLGFISGVSVMAAAIGAKGDALGKIQKADQMFLWMDNYCRANPLKGVESGAFALLDELQERR